MDFKFFLSLILLFFSIKYIFTAGKLYVINNVNSITNGKTIKHAKGQLRTTCLLKCQHDENCKKAFFKQESWKHALGECWLVEEDDKDEVYLPKTSESGNIETFQDVSYCGTKKPCTYGRCENRYNGTRYRCHCNDGDWKLLGTNICFGAKDNSYGNFSLSHTGILTKLKFEHTGATNLTCNTIYGSTPSRWGCTADPPGFLKIVITDNENTTIIPKSRPGWGYYIPGYYGQSAFLEFDNLNINAKKDEELRIWYIDDLKDEAEYDNAGTSCTNVHAVFCD